MSGPVVRRLLGRLKQFGIRRNLGVMRALLARLDDPHRSTPAVHIAGTNGKGSTAAFVESVLAAAGYRTLLYTSPHLHTYQERFRVNGRPVSAATLEVVAAQVDHAVDQLPVTPTPFDALTAMAWLLAAREQVDVVILEAGLGGRLDSTNVVAPIATAITTIGLDHTQILGTRLEDIAREKAGIIKQGIPCVVGGMPPRARKIIASVAAAAGAPVVPLPTLDIESAANPTVARIDGVAYRLGLAGAHQGANAACAVALCRLLDQRWRPVPEPALGRGLAAAHWPARLERFPGRPAVLLDGAHNAQGAAALAAALPRIAPRPRVGLVGALQDKDVAGMAQVLAPQLDWAVAVPVPHPRGRSAESVAAALAAAGVPALSAAGVRSGLREAARRAGPCGTVVVAGSLYHAAEVRRVLLGRRRENESD